MLASLFVAPSPAEARSSSTDLAVAVDDGVMELTPDEWDCVINYEVELVDFCIRLKQKPKSSTADTQLGLAAVADGIVDHGGPTRLCPGGTIATAFDEPVYTEDGLFVVGHETVWYCIPANTRPAG